MNLKKSPVTIKSQILFSFIPALDFYAFYRIGKLRKFFMLIGANVVYGIISDFFTIKIAYPLNIIIPTVIISPLSIYLIIRWSKDWNMKIRNEKHIKIHIRGKYQA